MDQNPYSTPQSGFAPSPSNAAGAGAGPALEFMRKSTGWVIFIAVVTFIGAAFSALAVVGAGMVMAMGMPLDNDGLPPVLDMATNVFSVIASIISGVLLVQYSGKMGQAALSQSEGSLEEALVAQQRFWKTWGIIIILNLLLLLVVLIALVPALIQEF